MSTQQKSTKRISPNYRQWQHCEHKNHPTPL